MNDSRKETEKKEKSPRIIYNSQLFEWKVMLECFKNYSGIVVDGRETMEKELPSRTLLKKPEKE